MEPGHLREVKEIEIAQLHLRYAHTRIEWPQKVLALASSIERFGQILPVIVLRDGANSFILIDGYLRVKAVKRSGAQSGPRCGATPPSGRPTRRLAGTAISSSFGCGRFRFCM